MENANGQRPTIGVYRPPELAPEIKVQQSFLTIAAALSDNIRAAEERCRAAEQRENNAKPKPERTSPHGPETNADSPVQATTGRLRTAVEIALERAANEVVEIPSSPHVFVPESLEPQTPEEIIDGVERRHHQHPSQRTGL